MGPGSKFLNSQPYVNISDFLFNAEGLSAKPLNLTGWEIQLT